MGELAGAYNEAGIERGAGGGAVVGTVKGDMGAAERRVEAMSTGVELTPEEAGYVLGLLKEHVEYYRLLAGNLKCSEANRARWEFLEGLWVKLVG
jgi:hypothetical protein